MAPGVGAARNAGAAGYSSAGSVVDVGADVTSFKVGDRVACTGSGYAGHVEVTSVPAKLCAHVPDGSR